MLSAIIQAIDHAAERLNKGAGAGIEVAKSQNGGAAGNNGNNGNNGTTDTTMFGKAVQTATNNIKDKLASLNNNPKVEKGDTEGAEDGAEKVEGAV